MGKGVNIGVWVDLQGLRVAVTTTKVCLISHALCFPKNRFGDSLYNAAITISLINRTTASIASRGE